MAIQKHCAYCGVMFSAATTRTQYCKTTCRVNAFNARKRAKEKGGEIVPMPTRFAGEPLEGTVLQPNSEPMGDVERLTRRDLEKADKLETPIGAACIALARRLDNPRGDTGSAMSAVAARLDEMLTRATRGALAAGPAAAYEDELTARRNGRGA